jgi:very-short-patch-repair endonuclease
LWGLLRNRKLGGAKFRRQHPIGPFIVDFCCASARLVVELDGSHHGRRPLEDSERDRVLGALGYFVLRFENSELRDRPEHVTATIRDTLEAWKLLRRA